MKPCPFGLKKRLDPIVVKKLQVLDQVNFNYRVKAPLKSHSVGSSANFLSPKPNGQGLRVPGTFAPKMISLWMFSIEMVKIRPS